MPSTRRNQYPDLVPPPTIVQIAPNIVTNTRIVTSPRRDPATAAVGQNTRQPASSLGPEAIELSAQIEESVPIIRKRGRPPKTDRMTGYIACPFSGTERQNPCLSFSKLVPKAKLQIRRHLANIRMKRPGEVSGNETHPLDDPLWNSDEVMELVCRREVQTAEQRRIAQQKRCRAAYFKAKSEMTNLRTQLDKLLCDGKLTQEEADSIILSRSYGSYRTKYRLEIEERIKAQQQMNRAALEQDLEQQRRNYAELRDRALAIKAQCDDAKSYVETQHNILSGLFNPDDHITDTNHLERNNFRWPSEPSTLAFYLIYAAASPIAYWPPDGSDAPDVVLAYRTACRFIHPDKALNYANALGGQQKMTDISAVLQGSKEAVLTFLSAETEGLIEEKKLHLKQEWELAKFRVLKAMIPNSSSFPPFFISYLVDTAASKIQKRNK